MSDDARERLAADQARLIEALSGKTAAPNDFDSDRIELAGRTLASKRLKGIVKTWPMLTRSLGGEFAEQFTAFGSAHSPHPAGPAADGLAFAKWLDSRGKLPQPAAREFVAAQLWRGLPLGLRVRRGILGVRLPLLGVRLFAIRRPLR